MPAAAALSFELPLSAAQLTEIWMAPTEADGLKLLARIAQIADFEEEPISAIWVDFMMQTLLFAKERALPPPKALAFFKLMNETHAHSVGVCV